jgi:DNA-binding response OmpR family regulator
MTAKNARILVVDDDESMRQMLQVTLSERGYVVSLAKDGREGLARSESDQPDLVLLDITMPGRSGLSVLAQLRQRVSRSPRVIILTALDEARHREFAQAHRADAYFCKPFNIKDLLGTIDAVLAAPCGGAGGSVRPAAM